MNVCDSKVNETLQT